MTTEYRDPIADLGIIPTIRHRILVRYTDDKGKFTGEIGTMMIHENTWNMLKEFSGGTPKYISMKKSDTTPYPVYKPNNAFLKSADGKVIPCRMLGK